MYSRVYQAGSLFIGYAFISAPISHGLVRDDTYLFLSWAGNDASDGAQEGYARYMALSLPRARVGFRDGYQALQVCCAEDPGLLKHMEQAFSLGSLSMVAYVRPMSCCYIGCRKLGALSRYIKSSVIDKPPSTRIDIDRYLGLDQIGTLSWRMFVENRPKLENEP